MKVFISILFILGFLSASSQKIAIKSANGVSGSIDYSKNPAQATFNITADAIKTVPAPVQTLLYGKANKVTTDSIKRDIAGIKDAIKSSQNNVANLNNKINSSSVLTTKKDTVIIALHDTIFKKDTVVIAYQQDTSLQTLKSRFDDLYSQITALKSIVSAIPEFNFSGFNGTGDSANPLLNKPLEVTLETRLALRDFLRPGAMVTQTDGNKPGTYGLNFLREYIFLY